MASKRCKTENSQKLENFVAANTITVRGSMIRLLGGGRPWIRWPKKTGGGHLTIMASMMQCGLLIPMECGRIGVN